MKPLSWLDWSPSSFARASAEDKCIVLFLGTFWSRWSSRMERDTFGDAEIVKVLENDYIPVKVDADRRPDIADRYAPGSLPATCFLDPAGRILYGAGFLDVPELHRLLLQLKAGYTASKGMLSDAVKQREALIAQVMQGRHPLPGRVDESIVERTMKGILATYDSANGGFGAGAKSPLVSSVRLMWRCGEKERVNQTLDAMTKRALYDPVDGAFFTGTVDAQWTKPSFERTVEDNGALAGLYLEAGRPEIAKRVTEWIGRVVGAEASSEDWYRTHTGTRPATDPTARLLDPESTLLRDRLALGLARIEAGNFLEAARIGDRLMPEFWSEKERGFLDRKPGVDELGELARPLSHLSETAKVAQLFFRLAAELDDKRFRQDAERILRAQPDFGTDYGHYTAELALAVKAR